MLIKNSPITTSKGFLASAVYAGLKSDSNPDLAFIYSILPAQVAGVYTQNLVKGHSLVRTKELLSSLPNQATFRGVLINSGNANACVGSIGLKDAQEMASLVAENMQCTASEILTCSTGVIGQRLKMDSIKQSIPLLVSQLNSQPSSGHEAMKAIMTTDTLPKEASISLKINGKTITLSGMAKGSGMIHPNLATMISILTTDAHISAALLQALLTKATQKSFNRVSVDGDTSVCDTVLLLANNASETEEILPNTKEETLFYQALLELCSYLAQEIARDGEGATKLVQVKAFGALRDEDAFLAVQGVCKSPLCKTAIFGEDANWGRILTAVGYSGAIFNPDQVDIYLGDLMVCTKGCGLLFDETKAKQILSQKEIVISIDFNQGTAHDQMWTCDFSYDYIKINGSYRS